jgi:hypothetical protein
MIVFEAKITVIDISCCRKTILITHNNHICNYMLNDSFSAVSLKHASCEKKFDFLITPIIPQEYEKVQFLCKLKHKGILDAKYPHYEI